MKAPLLLLPLLGVAIASCERPAEHRAAPGNVVEAPPPAPPVKNEAVASIMRPEVAEEAGAQPAPPPAEPLRGLVEFADSQAVLDDSAKSAIDALVSRDEFAAAGPIRLSGHSDSAGSDAQNLTASRRRAEAVRDYLVSKGVPAERITIVALGERRPLAPNAEVDGSDSPEGRRRNRRVEITVEPRAEAPAAPSTPDRPATPQ